MWLITFENMGGGGNGGGQENIFGEHMPPCGTATTTEGDQFKVNMGEKKIISNIDIEMYLTLLDNI